MEENRLAIDESEKDLGIWITSDVKVQINVYMHLTKLLE